MGYVVPKRDRHAKQEPHQHSNSLKKIPNCGTDAAEEAEWVA